MDSLTLLSKWGFSQNPFREPVAELERNASRYFVMPPYFSEVVGNTRDIRSTFVFGHRGDGKSTLRMEVEKYLEAMDPKPLIVDYSSFSEHTEKSLNDLDLDFHLEKILRLAVRVLLKEIEKEPSLLNGLSTAELARTQWYLFRFTPDANWKESERRWITALNALPEDQGWKRLGGKAFRSITSYLRHKRAEIERVQGGASWVSDVAKLALILFSPELPGAESLKQKALFELLEAFKTIIISSGFCGLVALVDRVDETLLFNDRPDLAARLLLPLVLAAPVLEMPGLAIKFFLPASVLDQLRSKLRTDRIRTFQLSWNDDSLRNALAKRLEAFSLGNAPSLDPFLEDSVRADFYRNIFYYSGSNPRNMLRLVDSVLTELCNTQETPEKINSNALDAGIRRFITIRTGELDANEYIRRLRERPEEPPLGTLNL